MRYVYILLATLVVGVIITSQPASAKEIDESCRSVEIIIARGSGQKVENQNNNNEEKTEMVYFRDRLFKILDNSHISHHSYELGAESYGGSSYPAVAINNLFVLLGAKTSGGESYAYGHSVDSGVGELRAYIIERAKKCPKARFVLAGYSQGAQVIGQSLSRLDNKVLSRIDYVALFGDPKLYLPEGAKKFMSTPDACKTDTEYSPWRRGTAGCKTYEGVLGARKPYLPDGGIHLRTGSWCNRQDGVCGSASIFNWSGHMKYKDVSIDDAVREASRSLRFGNTIIDRAEADSPRNARDVLIIIDASRLPKGDYKTYIKQQLESKRLIRKNNRIAIITFGENGYREFRLATGLTSDKTQLYNAIDSIPEYGSYYGVVWGFDYFERVSKMGQKLQWRPFAKRLTLLLDYQGMQTHCIDGLSACPRLPYNGDMYIDSVGGSNKNTMRSKNKVKNGFDRGRDQFGEDAEQIDDIMEDSDYQPSVIPTFGDYEITVGETAYFDVSRSYVINDGKIDSFHWDFNGDGKNDLTTYEPHAEHRFDAPYEGKVLVWACSASSAFCGLGEIDIKVAAKNGSTPTPPTSLHYEWSGPGEIKLSWHGGGENADKWFLYVGDVPNGYMRISQRSIVISDLDETKVTEVRLSSINSDGSLESEKVSIKVSPRKISQSGARTFGTINNAEDVDASSISEIDKESTSRNSDGDDLEKLAEYDQPSDNKDYTLKEDDIVSESKIGAKLGRNDLWLGAAVVGFISLVCLVVFGIIRWRKSA